MTTLLKIALWSTSAIIVIAISIIVTLYVTKSSEEETEQTQIAKEIIAQLPTQIKRIDGSTPTPIETVPLLEEISRLPQEEQDDLLETIREETDLLPFDTEWGETDVSLHHLDRKEPTSEEDEELEITVLTYAVVPTLLGNNLMDTYEETVGTVVSYLTPNLTTQLLNNPPAYGGGVDAYIETRTITKQDNATYNLEIGMRLNNYRIISADPEMQGAEEREELGSLRKNYTATFIKDEQHWYLNTLNEK